MRWGIKPRWPVLGWSLKPPSPWLPISVSALALIVATFSYFKPPFKARSALVVDRFDDHLGQLNVPALGEKQFHQLRMFITNNGQAPAVVHNVAISPEFSPTLMTPEHESQRMDFVTKNKATIGTTVNGFQIVTGQKIFFSSNAGFADETWSEFTSKKQLLYVFAVVSFSDESSGDREAFTEICVRLETNLNNWSHCASGHNMTVRR